VDWSEDSIKRLYAEIGARVRSARKQHGWNQVDLAHAVGLTRSSIANIEAGRQRALVHVVVLAAHALGVPVETLLPLGSELDNTAILRAPALDLEGQSNSTHDFVTTAIRRATGG
jgi:transcriptional regulator with XRE-family HTH domain